MAAVTSVSERRRRFALAPPSKGQQHARMRKLARCSGLIRGPLLAEPEHPTVYRRGETVGVN